MSGEKRCFLCGTEDVEWLRWLDYSIIDEAWRKIHGMPGPTAIPKWACAKHKEALTSDYPPDVTRAG